ncbi:methyltransferase domain-containing protein [Limosilactobacillus sp. STM2_1]|uniref:Methyltransferase domain-containing protein n=1 Tax=Limosilactobacillus rudii TaxID=2759755 RepID=A0A7W3UM85_9LACO|nr:class I SAM-dependent methyltransferase [Limosilactobacillus rudii]MBB1080024.1 methyltransferase domain-containing protein [Limosilactobacillus rudii]MBB1098157.1 methyltransferase domain-containing protein [Limosilactobacillus rudii]MCD7135229.1 methyltransferase domain-containing protein [Limosilactobacillus rudii]
MRIIVLIIAIIAVIILASAWGMFQKQLAWKVINNELRAKNDIKVVDMLVNNGKNIVTIAQQLVTSSKIFEVVGDVKQAQKLKSKIQAAAVADRAEIITDDVANLGFKDHSVNYVIINNLQQIKPAITRQRILQEAIRILNVDGTIFIINSSHLNDYHRLLEYYGFKNVLIKRIGSSKIMVVKRN